MGFQGFRGFQVSGGFLQSVNRDSESRVFKEVSGGSMQIVRRFGALLGKHTGFNERYCKRLFDRFDYLYSVLRFC